MDTMPDAKDPNSLVVLEPPVSMFHREKSTRCNLGSKSYCPGETLFRLDTLYNKSIPSYMLITRIGTGKVRAKVCSHTGKFTTISLPSNYQEPQSKLEMW